MNRIKIICIQPFTIHIDSELKYKKTTKTKTHIEDIRTHRIHTMGVIFMCIRMGNHIHLGFPLYIKLLYLYTFVFILVITDLLLFSYQSRGAL